MFRDLDVNKIIKNTGRRAVTGALVGTLALSPFVLPGDSYAAQRPEMSGQSAGEPNNPIRSGQSDLGTEDLTEKMIRQMVLRGASFLNRNNPQRALLETSDRYGILVESIIRDDDPASRFDRLNIVGEEVDFSYTRLILAGQLVTETADVPLDRVPRSLFTPSRLVQLRGELRSGFDLSGYELLAGESMSHEGRVIATLAGPQKNGMFIYASANEAAGRKALVLQYDPLLPAPATN